VSGVHFMICEYGAKLPAELASKFIECMAHAASTPAAYVMDTSTNGTFVDGQRVRHLSYPHPAWRLLGPSPEGAWDPWGALEAARARYWQRLSSTTSNLPHSSGTHSFKSSLFVALMTRARLTAGRVSRSWTRRGCTSCAQVPSSASQAHPRLRRARRRVRCAHTHTPRGSYSYPRGKG
jgi:hypothetical protein